MDDQSGRSGDGASQPEDAGRRLAAIMRMVRFAHQDAKDVGAHFPAYCLALSLGALRDEIDRLELGASDQDRSSSLLHFDQSYQN